MTNNNRLVLEGKSDLYFSYNQVIAYDASETSPGSLWTEQHFRQRFIRRPHTLGIGTLSEFGNAMIQVYSGMPSVISKYGRVIRVPIGLSSGDLDIRGPEEWPIQRRIHLDPGHFFLYFAQKLLDEEDILLDLFVEPILSSQENSCILKSEEGFSYEGDLLETGAAAL